MEQHGEALVCARYRYDEARRLRFKTVELVIEQTPWNPPKRQPRDDETVFVRIGYAERDLREIAKAAKGRWNPEKKVWMIRYGAIKGTALEKHIILDAFSSD